MLAIMTKLTPPPEQFAAWNYIRDETYVCFYSRATFEFIADHWQAEVAFEGENIALLRRRYGRERKRYRLANGCLVCRVISPKNEQPLDQ